MINPNPSTPNITLGTCGNDTNQQWYLDDASNLKSAIATITVIYSNVTWTADGYIRVGSDALVVPFDASNLQLVPCDQNNSCPMLAHQIFVLRSDFPPILPVTFARLLQTLSPTSSCFPLKILCPQRRRMETCPPCLIARIHAGTIASR